MTYTKEVVTAPAPLGAGELRSPKYSHWKLLPEEKERRAGERQAQRTHCVNNHEFTEKNTYVAKSGKKVCRTCQRNSQQKYHGRPVSGDQPPGLRNSEKTHCPQGHAYDEKNTIKKPDGSRGCYTCTFIRNRRFFLKKNYGITLEKYDEMLAAQGGACAICTRPPSGQELVVDHDHDTDEVRGLLCQNCNIGLGHFRDDPDLLLQVIEYLERWGRKLK